MRSALLLLAMLGPFAHADIQLDKLEQAAVKTFSENNGVKLRKLVFSAGDDSGTATIAPADRVKLATFKRNGETCELRVIGYESYVQHCSSTGWCSEPLAPYRLTEEGPSYNNTNGRLVIVAAACTDNKTGKIQDLFPGSASELIVNYNF